MAIITPITRTRPLGLGISHVASPFEVQTDYMVLTHDSTMAIFLSVLEQFHRAHIQAFINACPHREVYERMKNISEDELYLSLSLADMVRYSHHLLSERTLQRIIPKVEALGFVHSRFVRLDENGTILKKYRCVGQLEDIKGISNRYDFGDEDPALVTRAATKQYMLDVNVIMDALGSVRTSVYHR